MMSDYEKKDIEFKDKEKECPDCKVFFILTARDQEYYSGRQVEDKETGEMKPMLEPKRCSDCRRSRRLKNLKENKY